MTDGHTQRVPSPKRCHTLDQDRQSRQMLCLSLACGSVWDGGCGETHPFLTKARVYASPMPLAP